MGMASRCRCEPGGLEVDFQRRRQMFRAPGVVETSVHLIVSAVFRKSEDYEGVFRLARVHLHPWRPSILSMPDRSLLLIALRSPLSR